MARVGAHLRRRSHADDQPLGKVLHHVLEILERQRVPLTTPVGRENSDSAPDLTSDFGDRLSGSGPDQTPVS
jgi:hypothetical protein